MKDIIRQLDRIERKLDLILTVEGKNMASIQQVLDDVTAESTMLDGIGTLISGLRDQVAAAQGDQAKIDAAFDQAEANKVKLAAALQANVPTT